MSGSEDSHLGHGNPAYASNHRPRPTKYFRSNNHSERWWPDTMKRTYLWTLSIEAETTSSESDSSHCDHLCFVDPPSVPTGPSPSSFSSFLDLEHDMAQVPLSVEDCANEDRVSFPEEPALLTEPVPDVHLGHFASCESGLLQSLPASPRHPRLVRRRVTTRDSTHGVVSSLSCSSSRPDILLKSIEEEINDKLPAALHRRNWAVPRSNTATYPTATVTSHAPSIVLSPPGSPPSNHQSFASSTSSESTAPDTPASSTYINGRTTSAQLFQSERTRPETSVTPNEELASTLYHFSRVTRENKHVPKRTFTEQEFTFAHKLRAHLDERIVVIEEKDCESFLIPGMHGIIIPLTPPLKNILLNHARCWKDGSHVFVKLESELTNSDVRYQYLGVYDVERATETDYVKDETQYGEHGVFFAKFRSFDDSLFQSFETISVGEVPRTTLRPSFPAQIKRKTSKQTRIVNVEGINFEMAPSLIAWDHGSFRE